SPNPPESTTPKPPTNKQYIIRHPTRNKKRNDTNTHTPPPNTPIIAHIINTPPTNKKKITASAKTTDMKSLQTRMI
ncbi:hypothetical protein ACCS67_34870, partial [Rhizobium brockwellii]|uniref:hypothetical protein n=1 Tax=Rhizobium brockwellii TaxID=3019932 RepID=UPI003F944B13